MNYIRRIFLLGSLVNPISLFSGQFSTHTFPSIINPGIKKTIILPFPYKELNCEDKKNTDLLLESRFIVLEKGSKRQALVGPLNPCHLIALTNGEKTVIFHYNVANKIEQLCKIAEKILKTKNSPANTHVSGLIFANTTITPERTKFLKRSQKDSIKKIKGTIIEKLTIKEPNQIREVGFSFGTECDENNEEEYLMKKNI